MIRNASCSLLLAALLMTGCYPVNPRLQKYEETGGYRYQKLADDPERMREETFVVLTFSGGGTRAAAFAFGALQALRDTPIGGNHTLLDEVDVISSVSGGSFAAAYLALFGQREFFDNFPEAVLYRKLEYGLAARVLFPANWPRLLSPVFGRSDLADEYYDDAIFKGRRFADLPPRPFIVLNATDITRGAQFPFTQDAFDRLCSDLSQVHVSRAVTASSAFPVAFPPLTLKNYNDGPNACGYTAPPWVGNAEAGDFDAAPQRYDLAKTWRSYENAAQRPFVHLSDGGLSDNIGLRAAEVPLTVTNGWDLLDAINSGRMKRFVVIAVDAKPTAEPREDRTARPPAIYTVLNAAATNPMENYSSDTVERMRLQFKEWNAALRDYTARRDNCSKLAARMCAHKPPACEEEQRYRCFEQFLATEAQRPRVPKSYRIHVRFAAIPDEAVRRRLQGVDTRLQLDRSDVDLLAEWGRRLLVESKVFQGLVDDLKADSKSPPLAAK